MAISAEKRKAFLDMGGDETLLNEITGAYTDEIKSTAQKYNVTFKAQQTPPVQPQLEVVGNGATIDDSDTITINGRMFTVTGKAVAAPPMVVDDAMPPEAKADGAMGGADVMVDEEEDVEIEEEPIGAFTPEELEEMATYLAPRLAQAIMDALGPALNLETKLGGMLADLKGYASTMASEKKDTGVAPPDNIQAVLNELQLIEIRMKETYGDTIGQLSARVAELEGDVPTGVRSVTAGYRASTDPQTITTKTVTGPQSTAQPAQPAQPAANGRKDGEYLGQFITDLLSN